MRRDRHVEQAAVASFRVQRFAASDIGRVVMDPVSLLAASLLGIASLPPDAVKISVNPSHRPAHVALRLTPKRGSGARCKHGTPPATPPAVEAMQRQPAGSAPPDIADRASAAPIALLVVSGHALRRVAARDGPTPIPLLLQTRSLLI